MLLSGETAIIFGAGGAIGGAVAKAFAREGARLFLSGRSPAKASGPSDSGGGESATTPCKATHVIPPRISPLTIASRLLRADPETTCEPDPRSVEGAIPSGTETLATPWVRAGCGPE
jgi:NAD(P)-dependent dehydrogenase (short-subunit alcohol dehydrogenase family)